MTPSKTPHAGAGPEGQTGPYRTVPLEAVAKSRPARESSLAVDWIVVVVILGMVAYLARWPVLVDTVARWMIGFSPRG